MATRTSLLVRRCATLVAAAALTAVTGALPANAAVVHPNSSGGGCRTASGSPSIEGCLSASGQWLEPDAYIINNSGCQSAEIIVHDVTADDVQEDVTFSCSLGHHGPYPVIGVNGHTYYTLAIIHGANLDTFVASPNLTLSF
jgi:hypothetical protein